MYMRETVILIKFYLRDRYCLQQNNSYYFCQVFTSISFGNRITQDPARHPETTSYFLFSLVKHLSQDATLTFRLLC